MQRPIAIQIVGEGANTEHIARSMIECGSRQVAIAEPDDFLQRFMLNSNIDAYETINSQFTVLFDVIFVCADSDKSQETALTIMEKIDPGQLGVCYTSKQISFWRHGKNVMTLSRSSKNILRKDDPFSRLDSNNNNTPSTQIEEFSKQLLDSNPKLALLSNNAFKSSDRSIECPLANYDFEIKDLYRRMISYIEIARLEREIIRRNNLLRGLNFAPSYQIPSLDNSKKINVIIIGVSTHVLPLVSLLSEKCSITLAPNRIVAEIFAERMDFDLIILLSEKKDKSLLHYYMDFRKYSDKEFLPIFVLVQENDIIFDAASNKNYMFTINPNQINEPDFVDQVYAAGCEYRDRFQLEETLYKNRVVDVQDEDELFDEYFTSRYADALQTSNICSTIISISMYDVGYEINSNLDCGKEIHNNIIASICDNIDCAAVVCSPAWLQFLILLPETGEKHAKIVRKDLEKAINSLEVFDPENQEPIYLDIKISPILLEDGVNIDNIFENLRTQDITIKNSFSSPH